MDATIQSYSVDVPLADMKMFTDLISRMGWSFRKEANTDKSRAETESDWQEVCRTIKEAREGKIQGRPVEELLDEL